MLAAQAGEELSLHLAPGLALLIAVGLLAANAFFVAAEIALLAARRARIEELAESGDRRAVLAAAALRELSITFSGAQLGITMASLGLGAIAEPAVADLIAAALDATTLSEGVRHAIGFGVGLTIVVFLHMVVGEMVPKNVALARAEAVSLRVARVFRLYVLALRPLIVFLNATANGLVRLLGVEPRDDRGLVHTPEELALVVRESKREGALPEEEAQVLAAALALGEIDAGAAMTPRVDLEAVPQTAGAEAVLELAKDTGYTRFPVYDEDIDDIIGVVNVKDVLIEDAVELADLRVGQLLRPIPAVPESRDLEALLRDMRRDRSHAVLVVDEFGGTAGIVTLEDVLEELVGEIEDEFDPRDVHEEIRNPAPGRWLVPGTLRHDELADEVGLRLGESDAETVSGYITERLGRLVEPADEVEVDGWYLRVRSVEGRRAAEVEVERPAGDPTDTDAGDG